MESNKLYEALLGIAFLTVTSVKIEPKKLIIDAVLELPDKVYVIEFKFAKNTKVKQVSTLSRRAMKQIKDKKYYEAYLGGNKRVLLLGLGFLDKQLHGRVEEIN